MCNAGDHIVLIIIFKWLHVFVENFILDFIYQYLFIKW